MALRTVTRSFRRTRTAATRTRTPNDMPMMTGVEKTMKSEPGHDKGIKTMTNADFRHDGPSAAEWT